MRLAQQFSFSFDNLVTKQLSIKVLFRFQLCSTSESYYKNYFFRLEKFTEIFFSNQKLPFYIRNIDCYYKVFNYTGWK